MRAYAGDRWWVLLLPTAMAAVCVPVAMVLRSRRDLGAGLLTDRAGPSQGKLSSVSGLAWRLQRTVLISWAVGFAAFGFLLGSISDSVTGFLDSPQAAEYLQKLGGTDALADAFLAAELAIMVCWSPPMGLRRQAGCTVRRRTATPKCCWPRRYRGVGGRPAIW